MSYMINQARIPYQPGGIWTCANCQSHNFATDHQCRNCGTVSAYHGRLPPFYPQRLPNWPQPGLARPFAEGFALHQAAAGVSGPETPAAASRPATASASAISEVRRRYGNYGKNSRQRRPAREARGAERIPREYHLRANVAAQNVSNEELLFRTGMTHPSEIANLVQAREILQQQLVCTDAMVQSLKNRLEEAQAQAELLRRQLSSGFIPRDIVVAILEAERDER